MTSDLPSILEEDDEESLSKKNAFKSTSLKKQKSSFMKMEPFGRRRLTPQNKKNLNSSGVSNKEENVVIQTFNQLRAYDNTFIGAVIVPCSKNKSIISNSRNAKHRRSLLDSPKPEYKPMF
jgi:hypothetical protein